MINAEYNYYLPNNGLLEECKKDQNVALTGLLLLLVTKEHCKTFYPMSRIRPVTARPAPQ